MTLTTPFRFPEKFRPRRISLNDPGVSVSQDGGRPFRERADAPIRNSGKGKAEPESNPYQRVPHFDAQGWWSKL